VFPKNPRCPRSWRGKDTQKYLYSWVACCFVMCILCYYCAYCMSVDTLTLERDTLERAKSHLMIVDTLERFHSHSLARLFLLSFWLIFWRKHLFLFVPLLERMKRTWFFCCSCFEENTGGEQEKTNRFFTRREHRVGEQGNSFCPKDTHTHTFAFFLLSLSLSASFSLSCFLWFSLSL